MIKFMVMEKKADGTWNGFGSHEFRLAPRVGEYVEMNDSDSIGQTYEVLAVVHPLEPTMTAGDLVLRYVGDSVSFRHSFK